MNKINIENTDIYNSTITNNVTQILANFEEYNEWKSELDLAVQTLSSLPKDRVELHSKYEEKISFYRKNIENYEKQLKEALSDIKVDLDYQQNALNALGELKPDLAISILLEKTSYIKEVEQKVDLKLQEINQARLNVANHYLLLALSNQANYADPNWFNDTCNYFEHSIKNYRYETNILDYAMFLQIHNIYEKAKDLYIQLVNEFMDRIDLSTLANLFNNLGSIYDIQNEFETAEENFEKALEIVEKLKEGNSLTCLRDESCVLNNLGLLNYNRKYFDDAEYYLQKALGNNKLLAASDSNHLADVAFTLTNLGLLYKDQSKDGLSLQSFESALEIFRKLKDMNSEDSLHQLATALNNLAVLNAKLDNKETALHQYQEALAIRRSLADKNPQKFLFFVAGTLSNLANLNQKLENFDSASIEYEEALKIYRKLATEDPSAYLPNLAKTLNNLANLHCNQKKFEIALSEYQEALQIREELVAKSGNAFVPDVITTITNLSIYYFESIPNREISIDLALKALEMILSIIDKLPFLSNHYVNTLVILENWGLNDEEIHQLIDKKIKGNEQN